MRFISASALVLAALFSSAVGADLTTDVCGEVDVDLKLPNLLFPGKDIIFGHIRSCLCKSNLPDFLTTHDTAIAAKAMYGADKTSSALSDLIDKCPGQTCHYPPHSVPLCLFGNACGFICKDGYLPYPLLKPTQCVCKPPFSECNGKCGLFFGCPSPHAKRDFHPGTNKQMCAQGYTACGIPARSAKAWECLNTQTELESCGGCVLPLSTEQAEGVDCTAIAGVSDVSCIKGKCLVHRCMPGYETSDDGNSCVYIEDKDPVFLAAQYGLEHIPL